MQAKIVKKKKKILTPQKTSTEKSQCGFSIYHEGLGTRFKW